MKAFRGPNGWYVANEDEAGTHRQPESGGEYETKAAALASENPPDGCWVDYDGTIYDGTGEAV